MNKISSCAERTVELANVIFTMAVVRRNQRLYSWLHSLEVNLWFSSAQPIQPMLIMSGKLSSKVRWKQKWKHFKGNFQLECCLLTEYCLSNLNSCPDGCWTDLIFWAQSVRGAWKTENMYPRGLTCLQGFPLSFTSLFFALFNGALALFSSTFICSYNKQPLLSSLTISPQAKCFSSNASRRWTMQRQWRLVFEMAQRWPKWVRCTLRGNSNF